jgi:hypothetical protein
MNEIFDKFLQEQKDNVYVEGVKTLKKGVRSSVTLTLVGDDAADGRGDDDDDEVVEVSIKEVDVAKEYEEQEKLQSEYREAVEQMIAESSVHDKEIETCQEYLQETRIDDEWDCETILSTYSTLDNHPTVIKDTNSKFKKYKSRYAKEMDAIEDRKSRGTGSIASIASSILGGGGAGSVSSIAASLRRQNHSSSGSSMKSSHEQQPVSTVVVIDKVHSATRLRQAALSPSSTPQPSKIVLAGRLNLPEGYGPGSLKPRKRDEKDRKGATARATKGGSLEEIAEESSEENEDEKSVDGHEDEDDDDDEGDDKNTEYSSEQKQGKGHSSSRLKMETSAEKKARKSQVKEENRRKRLEKKELKTMFKVEGSKLTRSAASEQSTDHVSVFRY